MLHIQGFKNLKLMTKTEDEENIKKLVDGSIDLWPTLLKAGLYNARRQGLSGEIEPIEDVVAFRGDLYIAFNIQTDDKIIQKWQDAFNKLKKEKTIKKIIQRYEAKPIDYSLFIKILIAIIFIIVIVIYHNRKLSRINKQLKALQKELQEQAYHDHLTNLYNRRYFSNIATTIMKMSKRDNQKISIIMLDIDHFKLVNDTYGHNIGDDVIKHLAKLLLKYTRVSDIVARFGGEEFVILLPNTDIVESINIASKLRKHIEDANVKQDKEHSLKFTVSFGVDQVLQNDENINLAITRADKALYKAKELGRNRVCTLEKCYT